MSSLFDAAADRGVASPPTLHLVCALMIALAINLRQPYGASGSPKPMINQPVRLLWVSGSMLLTLMGLSTEADAAVFAFSGISGANGQALSASAEFQVSGTNVTVILTNTATAAANDGANVLAGLYFDLNSSRTFSNGNAFLTSGSNLVKKNDNSNQVGNSLNNEWMFKAGVVSTGGQQNFSADYGIGATGFNFSPNADTFAEQFHGGNVMAGANDDYGLVPTLGITVGSPSNLYMRNSATFTFTVNSTFSESDIRNVRVSYGSAGQSVIQSVPEPTTMSALTLGLAAAVRNRRRRK